MGRSGAAISLTLVCLSAGGCFATQDESLGQVRPDAGAPRADAAPEMEDLPPFIGSAASIPDATALAQGEDAALPPAPLDAGLVGSNGDASHAHDASDGARDARKQCREPWEPWECRG